MRCRRPEPPAQLASSMLAPGLPQMGKEFHTSNPTLIAMILWYAIPQPKLHPLKPFAASLFLASLSYPDSRQIRKQCFHANRHQKCCISGCSMNNLEEATCIGAEPVTRNKGSHTLERQSKK